MKNFELYNGDCIEVMDGLADKSIDLILCDLPYGVLNKGNVHSEWDVVIPFDKLWKCYNRIIKDNGAILLFAQGMFTANLMCSNPDMWRYNLIWDKCFKTGFLNANRMPLRQHEDIVVFYKLLPTYNPQMVKVHLNERNHSKGGRLRGAKNSCYGNFKNIPTTISDEKYPTSIIKIPKEHINGEFFHPTQKPVALMEYLIKTYSNECETVLDNTMGSGSTGVACMRLDRKFIGIEKEEKYFKIAESRIVEANKRLF